MASVIKLRKGLDISLKGKAAEEFFPVKETGLFAMIPDDFPGVTPKVAAKADEKVKAGEPLFFDKNHPELKIVSPVSGTVMKVERGARRKILNITVKADENQEFVDFGVKPIDGLTADEVKEILLKSGMFAYLRQRPYDVVADPTAAPKGIFISAFDTNPLARNFELALQDEDDNFQTGLNALAKLAKVYLNIQAQEQNKTLTEAKNVTLNRFEGPHPAGNVGVQIHHINPINKGETVWTIDPEAVIFIGRLFATGKVDFTRTIAVTGSEVKNPGYCKVKVGSQLTPLFEGNTLTDQKLRYISGNVLTGRQVEKDGFLGAFSTQVTVIPEGDETHELFGWISPRLDQYSVNHSYFTWLQGKGKKYVLDARIKGGQRHMIMSNEYDKVLPMDILPEFLIKAILAGDIDKMEQLGIYEVAPEDFALCEFVCSSKMELQRIVRTGLMMLRKEMC